MQTPNLDPCIGMFLLERYPGLNRHGIASMWSSALAFVEDHLPSGTDLCSEPAFEVAALHRLRAICEADPQRKAGFMFSAHETLAPFLRR